MFRALASLLIVRVCLLMAGFVVCPLAAEAQTTQETALARSLFEEGVRLADQGQWPEAADRFRRAFTLKPTPGIAFNLASALGEAGKLVEATELLEQLSRDPTLSPELRAEALHKLEVFAPRRAHLTVQISEVDHNGLTVEVDDQPWPQAAWGVAVPIDPGTHRVVGRAPLERVSESELPRTEGERATQVLPLSSSPLEATSEQATGTRSRGRDTPLYKRWVLWAGVATRSNQAAEHQRYWFAEVARPCRTAF
jgi:hypothetical protein